MAGSWTSVGPDVHLDWDPRTGRQGLADALRDAVRTGRLAHGSVVPSTRALAADLGIARGTVTRVYTDLAAEGYLRTRQGAPTTVAAHGGPPASPPRAAASEPATRWSLRPGSPDLSAFPRTDWLAATRRVLHRAPSSAFGYTEERGARPLREALARYLARSRGVLADPERIVVCGGYSHAMFVLATALRERGERDLAFENPSLWIHRDIAAAAGLTVVAVPVDADGIRVSELDTPAVVVTPAHQYPLGMTLAPGRRSALARWATTTGGLVVEDDYDGEFRFDREPVGALQALAPERIAYAGTASKTLAPGLRLGWLVLPRALVDPVRAVLTAQGWRAPVMEQLVLAELIDSGAYDRHVRRRRTAYRTRRDRLLAALPRALSPQGISAGLQVLLTLPEAGPAERDVLAAARRHSLTLETLGPHWHTPGPHRQGLVLGYATPAEHAFSGAVEALSRTLADVLG
ncbi:PLP-dependent aminotransferase family protein [Prauserella muralis]|uniref:GntR family transcriptional regulator n=1 Tax=Prauserella muralis TaxID=588067 RepID=A0A2V4AKD8_9PSEU|nr:PLP-dependent aminotransferase family protein [Prauserella muralis]PXY20737.1 GntR family transcriptional regulator [Prauserella muralis]TWE29745.1 GntR family transcriptional regulator/MocR family aminotransferase [Prauserella muralis]